MKMTRGKQEAFVKRSVFLSEKYFFNKRLYLVKSIFGAVLFWGYEFYSIFGSIANYKQLIVENIRLMNESEMVQYRLEIESFRTSLLFLACLLGLLIISLMMGYFISTIIQVLIDLVRGKVFQGYENQKER